MSLEWLEPRDNYLHSIRRANNSRPAFSASPSLPKENTLEAHGHISPLSLCPLTYTRASQWDPSVWHTLPPVSWDW